LESGNPSTDLTNSSSLCDHIYVAFGRGVFAVAVTTCVYPTKLLTTYKISFFRTGILLVGVLTATETRKIYQRNYVVIGDETVLMLRVF
jgi:hypothetical protein